MEKESKFRTMNEIEHRPWGKYEVLLDDPTTKVKRITVNPNQKLSYQYHHKRQECWTVIKGELTIVLDDEKVFRKYGETIRIPLGAKTRSGPFHANMIESWFMNAPGLTIVFPSNPQDAYDLLIESHQLDDPVVFLEHLGLYGLGGGKTGWGDSINQVLDTKSVIKRIENNETTIGKANVIRGGKDLTIITWGAMVHVALKVAEKISKEGFEIEIIDLRTILPFDTNTCIQSVMKTKKMIILQESQYTGGLGHTVSSRIMEESFWDMEYPPVVIGALDTPVPFSPTLEDHTIPTVELVLRHVKRMVINK